MPSLWLQAARQMAQARTQVVSRMWLQAARQMAQARTQVVSRMWLQPVRQIAQARTQMVPVNHLVYVDFLVDLEKNPN